MRIFVAMSTQGPEEGSGQTHAGVCTHVGVGFPAASQGRLMSSRENAVSDVGISVSTGGSDTENMQ